MSNTQRLGSIWKGRAWDDGEVVPRTTLPDGTLAEAMAALGYGWDATNSVFRKILVDTSGNLFVSLTGTAVTQPVSGTVTAQGTDGISSLTPKVQNRAGDNVLFTYDAAISRLLEEVLVELRIANVQRERLLGGTQQADYRADLKLAL